MEDIILLRRILEGLIHNLNNSLNLILGYAQRLQTIHPEVSEAEKILKAGFQIDDQLQMLTAKLMENTLTAPQQLDLNEWLEQELKYLQNYLPLKHKLVPVIQPTKTSMSAMVSPLILSAWLEAKLLIMVNSDSSENQDVTLSIVLHRDKAALRIGFSHALEQDLWKRIMIETPESSLADPEQKLRSFWDADSNSLLGILP